VDVTKAEWSSIRVGGQCIFTRLSRLSVPVGSQASRVAESASVVVVQSTEYYRVGEKNGTGNWQLC